jgi:phosphoglycolate phosphatase-like HAD superfamily hydrolase
MKDVLKYQNYIFDFDGVILDSNHLKGNAFYEVACHFSPATANDFLEYHRGNPGINRRHKFRHFFENLLGMTDYQRELERALDLFVTVSLKKMLSVPFVHGVQEFLDQIPPDRNTYIVSAGDESDLHKIVNARGIQPQFDGVFGGPKPKIEIIQGLSLKGSTIYFGDSEVDLETANHFGHDFIFVSEASLWLQGRQRCVNVIKNFSEILKK